MSFDYRRHPGRPADDLLRQVEELAAAYVSCMGLGRNLQHLDALHEAVERGAAPWVIRAQRRPEVREGERPYQDPVYGKEADHGPQGGDGEAGDRGA